MLVLHTMSTMEKLSLKRGYVLLSTFPSNIYDLSIIYQDPFSPSHPPLMQS